MHETSGVKCQQSYKFSVGKLVEVNQPLEKVSLCTYELTLDLIFLDEIGYSPI